MLLTPLCLMLSLHAWSWSAACLRVIPDRSQFFRYDSILLGCGDHMNSTDWTVKRKTSSGVRTCSVGWGSGSPGSACVIKNTYPSDTGVYWCESVTGERSISVNITITDRTVILESPALPVAEGAAVTMLCKAETSSPDHVFHFYKDGRSIRNSSTGQMTIHSASKTVEGFYKCSVSGGGESQSSWLAVDAASLTPSSAPSSAPPSSPSSASSGGCCSFSRLRIVCHLVVGAPYLLSTILLGLIYRDRNRAVHAAAERRSSKDVVMEIVV